MTAYYTVCSLHLAERNAQGRGLDHHESYLVVSSADGGNIHHTLLFPRPGDHGQHEVACFVPIDVGCGRAPSLTFFSSRFIHSFRR